MSLKSTEYVDKLTEAVSPSNWEPALRAAVESEGDFFRPLIDKYGNRALRARRISRMMNECLFRISEDIDILEAVMRCYSAPSDIAYAVCCWLDAFDRAEGASARDDIRQALLKPGPVEQSIVYSDVLSPDRLRDDYVL